MRYRNPQIPEGINVSERHPLREFAVLAGGALLLVVLLAWLFGEFGGQLARLVPFDKEQTLAPVELLHSDAGAELQAYLDQLGARLAEGMEMPQGMQVHLHFDSADTFNAFATLGGNILLFRGLLEAMPHENALAMLLAHEIAHVAHRDPIVGIGRGAAIQVAAGLLLGNPDLAVLGNAGIYTQLYFNRDMERAADAAALAAVQRVYGHVAGAADLFKVIQAEKARSGSGEPPAIFNSHPLDRERLQAIGEKARAQGWQSDGSVAPLPESFSRWLQQAAAADSPAEPPT